MTGYKVLSANGNATHGAGKWRKGRPRGVRGPLVPCENGIHYATRDQLIHWIGSGAAVWTFEDLTPDETIDAGNKMVTHRGVVVERCANWNERTQRLFACDCAERVLRREKRRGRRVDPRSVEAIKVARAFANGNATVEDLAAAGAAARVAEGDAAWDAAWAAARDKERSWQTKRLFDYIEGRRG